MAIHAVRRKVFISYYHDDDQSYKNKFEKKFDQIFINKSVKSGDINTDVSADYIKRLIQEDYISDSSVLLVLIGPNTKKRKHVDWEISAALNKKVGGYSGLAGILLPTFPLSSQNKYNYDDIPPRLADNVKSGYANVYAWSYAYASESNIKSIVQTSFAAKSNDLKKINNSRLQFEKNRA